MKKLVLEFSPLTAILLIIAVIVPVSITGMITDPTWATVDNCTINSPTTLVPAFTRTSGTIGTVTVNFNVHTDNITNGDIRLTVYQSGTSNLIGTTDVSSVPLPIAGWNNNLIYIVNIPMGTSEGLYDVVVGAKQPAGTAPTYTWSAAVPLTSGMPGYQAIRVKNSTPTATALLSPANGSYTKVNTPFLSWSCVTDPTGISYNYQVSTDSSFSSATTLNVATCNVTLGTLPEGTWYWRAQSKDGATNTSSWTAPWSFCLDTQLPPVVILSAPISGTPLPGSYNPNLQWSAVIDPPPSCGLRYWVQVSSGSTTGANGQFTSCSENNTLITNNSYTPGAALGAGTWYWHVKARDLSGNESATWSAIWNFVKPASITTYTQYIAPGWSLYALPLCPSGNTSMTPDQLLAACDNISAVAIIWGYDSSGTGWQYYIPGSTSTLTSISVCKGYWIQATSPINITINGSACPPPPQSLITCNLYPGWNLTGFKSTSPILATTYFGSCSANISFICSYASGWNCGAPGVVTMQPGQGYWAYHGGTTTCSYGLPCY